MNRKRGRPRVRFDLSVSERGVQTAKEEVGSLGQVDVDMGDTRAEWGGAARRRGRTLFPITSQRGRVRIRGGGVRTRESGVDRLQIVKIESLPRDTAMELPLRKIYKRVLRPSNPTSTDMPPEKAELEPLVVEMEVQLTPECILEEEWNSAVVVAMEPINADLWDLTPPSAQFRESEGSIAPSTSIASICQTPKKLTSQSPKISTSRSPKKSTSRTPKIKLGECEESIASSTPIASTCRTPKKSTSQSPKKEVRTPKIKLRECEESIAPSTPIASTCQTPKKSTSLLTNSSRLTLADDRMFLNYGSESDCSDDEEEVIAPTFILSRVNLEAFDTPVDGENMVEPPRSPPALPEIADEAEVARPNNFFHFEWRNYPDRGPTQLERKEVFSETSVGPTKVCVDPYKIFTSIWDANIMEHIVRQTNKYAQEVMVQRCMNKSLSPYSRIMKWKPTCVDELYTFFAIILSMGVVIRSNIEEYWSSEKNIFMTPGFRIHMKLNRFQILHRFLHFNDNEAMGRELNPGEAKLYKIEPITTHINAKFQSMYTMGQNIALDESLMQWKGWLNINQFISNKRAKVGIKTYEVCESQTGYLWKFEVHYKKPSLPVVEQPSPLDASTPTIVLNLLRGLEGKGYTVWMDNYYNSPALARKLKTLGFDVAGTLRTNRQFVPQELAELTKLNMNKGEIAGLTSGDVDILVWMDDNRVATISTYHGNGTQVVEDKLKPCVVLDYNIMMGGVDKKDQLLSMYPIERKRTKIWYKKFFRRLLNVSVLNSMIIAKKSGSILSHRNFRKQLTQQLLSRHSHNVEQIPDYIQEDVFHAHKHHTLEYPFGSNRVRLRRQCCICKTRTHLYCAGCDRAVCLGDCFVQLHS